MCRVCAACSAASWVRHRLCSVDLASDHGRASVFRAVHGMRSGDLRTSFAWATPGDRLATGEGKNYLHRRCFGCVSCGFPEGGTRCRALYRARDAPVHRRGRHPARSRPREVLRHPNPGVSEGPGGGFWGLQGRPERSSRASGDRQASSPAPRERSVGGEKALGTPRGGSRGGVIVDRGPPEGWRHRIRSS